MIKVIFSGLMILQFVACASVARKPASAGRLDVPAEALTLERALSQGLETTLPYLKIHLTSAAQAAVSFDELPDSIRIARGLSEGNRDKTLLRTHLRKFHGFSYKQKINLAQDLIVRFDCSAAAQSQAMGLTLERDFPDSQARTLSEILHQKVVQCDLATKEESWIRLALFSLQNKECDQALSYLANIPSESRTLPSDRRAYLENFCHPTAAADVAKRNPWGGYGIQLAELKIQKSPNAVWFLSSSSGQPAWDQLLKSLIDLSEKKDFSKIRALATQMDFEKFRHLEYPFQAAVLTLLHEAHADLSVFQTLHRFLADNPQLISSEVTGLLFPVRFWSEIQSNSSGDPILVKALIRQESAFNPSARSSAKAFGLMQLIFPTAKRFGVRKKKDLLDPVTNIKVGSRFLENLIRKFGSVELALAAYNAGPVVVQDWIQRYPTSDINLFVELIPYSETREYVRLVTRNYKIYQSLLSVKEPERQLEKPVQTPGFAILGK